MKSNIAEHRGYWIYSGVEPVIGEHRVVEFTFETQGIKVFIQVDFFDNEYTFSATDESVRPFFDENAADDLIIPGWRELFGQIPPERESRYVTLYRQGKLLLDLERRASRPTTVELRTASRRHWRLKRNKRISFKD